MITQHSIIPGEITEFVMEGACDVDEVLNIIKSQYRTISKGILWNLSAGSISNLNPDDMRRIANMVREHAMHKKTAYFGSVDLEFGLLRTYEAYAEMECVPPVMKVYRDRNEAIEWLKG
jgi:dihydrodipicolinate synthase/N-acetylneuraminate lyase